MPTAAGVIASFADNGQPPKNDTFAITLLGRDGGLLFSSKWAGGPTTDQTIDGGSITVHLHK